MPKSKSKPVAAKSITQEIAALRAMTVPELVARYEDVFGKPPRVKHRDWLWRRIAWKLQEKKYGGLAVTARVRLDELIAELDLPLLRDRTKGGRQRPGDPPIGTILTRAWKGHEIHATAVDGGWEHDGVVYRSLSAVAKAVTGSHWSGPLFFNLKQRRSRE